MIKARAHNTDGRQVLILGLSRANLERLPQDQPIRVTADDLRELGIHVDLDVLLIGGETESSIAEQLVQRRQT